MYEYGRGWVAGGGDWRPWIYVGPYQTIQVTGTEFLFNATGSNRYLAAAVYVYWWQGTKDWNWMYADSPNFGYPVVGSYWCHIT
jgi:hypothetical protein